MINSTPQIQMINVQKSFGKKQVLTGMHLNVMKGESLVIVGGSGSGKSVAIKHIIGLIKPDCGQILFEGEDITHHSFAQRIDFLRQCGMLFQGGALFDSLTVWRNIAFAVMQGPKALKPKTAKELAIEKLAQVGMPPEVADLMPAELSGGMQKRVGLARAIATDPKVIFFDEPTTGLDPIMADVINDLIVSCVKKLGSTAITITHDMASVRKIASRVAMIYDGRIIWDGPVGAVDNSGNAYVDQFVHGRAEGPIETIGIKRSA
jgi:phospholipid/cholesterol/gamma-HCH transport system ATP-binding protein